MPLRLRQEVQALPRQAGKGLIAALRPAGRRSAGIAVALALLLPFSASAFADSPRDVVAARACAAILTRVNAVPGSGPVFLRSYDDASGQGAGKEPALGGAFTYDNALAAIALQACGQGAAARRIGDALLLAADNDRSGAPGRLRNVYRPGAVTAMPVPPMGWWSDAEHRWDEDPYEVGSAAGNLAWGALALLTLAAATHDQRYVYGAVQVARWTIGETRTGAGFMGGIYGYDDKAQRLTWKSTEQNTDLVAVFDWLARLQPQSDWKQWESSARSFVAAQWSEQAQRFWIGTLPDGATPNRADSGLDAELWPLLLPDAPKAWGASLATVERTHRVGVGFDFNDDRDGIWWEGTAQAALVYRATGAGAKADAIFAALETQFSPGGFIWATDRAQITTGLALSPQSTTDDFRYYRLPHLGATAWAALAATGWNPFTGTRVGN
jgi:hypothetical protein